MSNPIMSNLPESEMAAHGRNGGTSFSGSLSVATFSIMDAVTIYPGGRIDINPRYETTEAARAFWTAVREMAPTFFNSQQGGSEGGEVMASIPLKQLRSLVRAGRECAEDLQSEIDSKYPEDQRAEQPSVSRRHMRDSVAALTLLDLVVQLETTGLV